MLAPDGVDTYTVTAHATVDEAAWEGDTLACIGGERPTAGGFLNIATVTVNGTDDPGGRLLRAGAADDPEGRRRGDAGPGRPDAVARLVRRDGDIRRIRHVLLAVRHPGFPAGVDLGDGRAQRTDIPDQPVLPITTGSRLRHRRGPAAGATHVYRVSWLVDVTDGVDPDDADCTGQPGSGFFNTATLTVGAIPVDDADCIPVVDRVYPTITKTATSTNQDPGHR